MKKDVIRDEKLTYIVCNVNLLSMKDKKIILNLFALEIDKDKFTDCADGCRVIIDDISDDTIDAAINIISYMIEK